MAGDSALPEIYHLNGGSNFGMWSYRMKNLLQKDGRFHYCLTPASKIMGEEEKTARQQVMSIINSNAKNNALKLLRRHDDPYECWTGLKTRYKFDSGPRRVMLIEKFFALRKTESISMDAHLTEVKEVANLLEEVEVNIPEDIIVYYTLKNLPKEYEIFKRMQIAAQTLPTFEQLEAKLISEEISISGLKTNKRRMEKPFLFIEIGADDHNLVRDRTTLRHPKTLGSLNTTNGVLTQEVFRERDPSTGRIEEASQHRITDKRTLHQIRGAQHQIRTSQGIEVGD
jgi:hypothetical protein